MGNIKKRAFGADIDVRIKKKLEARQIAAATNINPTDSVDGSNYQDKDLDDSTYQELLNNQFDGVAELSSRKPFARLWTALQVKELVKGTYPKYFDVKGKNGEAEQKKVEALLVKNPGKLYFDTERSVVNEYKKLMSEPVIYTIGSHDQNVLEDDKPFQPRDQISKYEFYDIFPQPLVSGNTTDSQQFHNLNSPAGITKVSSQTQGAFGQTVKTSVEFTVYSFRDYEKIYSRYFLKPGAQVFLDMGWSNIDKLYDPKEMFTEGADIEDKIYGEDGEISKHGGDMKIMVGNVINFDAKITNNGVTCSIEFLSKNSTLLESNIVATTQNKIKTGLDIEVLRWVVAFFGNEKRYGDETDKEGFATGKSLADMAGKWTTSTQSEDEVREVMQKFASNNLAGAGVSGFAAWVPGVNGRRYGVFQAGDTQKNKLYVSLGWVEDNILNTLFGDNDKSGGDNKFGISFDSGNSFLTYSKWMALSQPHKKFSNNFLYPEDWDAKKESELTYNMKLGKVPEERKDPSNGRFIKGQNYSTQDKKDGKVPVRECFISCDAIKESITDAPNSKVFITNLMKFISDSTESLVDLTIRSTDEANTTYEIIDKGLGAGDTVEDSNWFDDLFIFNAVSPNTQVKNFEMSFTMPQGNLSNTIAIQQMSGKASISPLTSMVDDTAALEQLYREDKQNLVMEYAPNIGDAAYRKLLIREMLDDANSARGENPPLFQDDGITDTLSTKDNGSSFKPDMERAGNVTTYNFQMGAAVDDSVAIRDDREGAIAAGWNNTFGSDASAAGYNNVEETEVDAAREREIDALNGKTSFSSLVKYYMGFARQEIFMKRKNLLPVELSLELYGISSLTPGDIFRMSYIPRMYFKNCYFQIMEISDDLGSDSWTTSLKCQMRIRDIKKGKLYKHNTGDIAKEQKIAKSLDEIISTVQPIETQQISTASPGVINPRTGLVTTAVDNTAVVIDVPVITPAKINNPNLKNIQQSAENNDETPPLVNYGNNVVISNTIFSEGEYASLKLNSATIKNMTDIKIVETPDGDDHGVDLAITFKAVSDMKEMGRSALYFVHNEGQDGSDIFEDLKDTIKPLLTYDGGSMIEFDDDGWEANEQSYIYELHPKTNKIKKNKYYLLMVRGMRVLITKKDDPVKAMKAFGGIGDGVNDKGGTPDNFDQQGSFWGDGTTKEAVYD